MIVLGNLCFKLVMTFFNTFLTNGLDMIRFRVTTKSVYDIIMKKQKLLNCNTNKRNKILFASRLKMEAENVEATRLKTILTLPLSNLGEKYLEESLLRKKTKSFKHWKFAFFTLKRNWKKLLDSKRRGKSFAIFKRSKKLQELWCLNRIVNALKTRKNITGRKFAPTKRRREMRGS